MEQLIKSGLDYDHAITERAQIVFFGEKTIDMVEMVDGGFTEDEILEFTDAPFRYGIYKRDLIPHIVFELGIFELQISVNIYEIMCDNSADWIDNYAGDASITLVNKSTLETTAKRDVLFSRDFLSHLKNCLRQQLQAYSNEYSVLAQAKMQAYALEFDQMIKSARMYRHP